MAARAKSLGITVNEYIVDLLILAKASGLQIEIKPKRNVIARLAYVAECLEIDPATFACTIIERYLSEIFKNGTLEELEVDGSDFASEEEKRRIMARVEVFDRQRLAFREGRKAL